MVELTGEGGIFQHAVALAELLDANGVELVLHTTADAELKPGGAVAVCTCMRWFRGLRRRHLRLALVLASYLATTVPHLAATVHRGDVLHFQSEFKAPLTSLLLLALRLRSRPVVRSMHNTFSRRGGRLGERLLRLDARLAHATVVFNREAVRQVRAWGGRPFLSELLQLAPAVDLGEVERWRLRWRKRPVVLFAGQIRKDKRLDLLIEASRHSPWEHTLAVVGEDKGDASRCRALAEAAGVEVEWSVGYERLESFVAALAAADVAVCPYARASQSGVLALARAVGTPTVATSVGGLAEQATVLARSDDPEALAEAVRRALEVPPIEWSVTPAGVLDPHRAAYSRAGAAAG